MTSIPEPPIVMRHGNINDRAVKLVGTGHICSSCGRQGEPGCAHCYRELVKVSSEWAKENLVLHKKIKEMEHTIKGLLKREFE